MRLRLPIVKKLIKTAQPDIICLQETKTEDQLFPAEALAKARLSAPMLLRHEGL